MTSTVPQRSDMNLSEEQTQLGELYEPVFEALGLGRTAREDRP